jgi:hypothetical protein
MNPDDVVPKIDLAPKLKRPLSLLNPLDYLRLLYWVFYFPQALRWYEKTFVSGEKHSNSLPLFQRLQRSPVLVNFTLQGFIVLLITNFIYLKILGYSGFKVSFFGSAAGVIWGVVTTRNSSFALRIVSCITNSMVFGIVFIGYWNSISRIILIGIIQGIFMNLILSVHNGMYVSIALRSIWRFASSICVITVISTFFCIAFDINQIVTSPLLLSAAWSTAFSISFLRIDSWLLERFLYFFGNHHLPLSHVSLIPTPLRSRETVKHLTRDWTQGIYNANQIFTYTVQSIQVIQDISFALSIASPENLLPKLSRLFVEKVDLEIIKFASIGFIGISLPPPDFIARNFPRRWLEPQPRLDTPASAAASGFWYLIQDLTFPVKSEDSSEERCYAEVDLMIEMEWAHGFR